MQMKKRRGLSLRAQAMGWLSAIVLVVLLSLGIATAVGQYTSRAFDTLLVDNAVCYQVQDAIKAERRAFARYVREASQESVDDYTAACAATAQSMEALPFDYTQLGEDRYARTWNLRQGYAGYCASRDAFLQLPASAADYAEQMYRVMDQQEDLAEYALRLTQATLEQENRIYSQQAQQLERLPWLYLVMLCAAMLGVLFILRQLSAAVGLAASQEAREALHKEEVRNLALEKDLEHTRLEVLKSQVNPHFLFNTLNMISCMARLEDAADTDQMIVRLGSLFRHNLRTKRQVIPLEEELEGLDDYIYLQQMRFDGRIRVEKQIEVDPAAVTLPSFTLQPILENAFSHGLKSCEEGGCIRLRAWQEGKMLCLTVEDNGKGMTEAELAALQEKIKQSEKTGKSIGLGNISRRISMLYPAGGMTVESREGQGTTVRFVIPQTLGQEEPHEV